MKVYLKTFGCRANQYDTESVRALLERAGGEIVEDPEAADAAVFNSCAVTAEAEVDLRKSVRGVARRNPALRTVVMGCAASLDRGDIRGLPTVQYVVPGGDALAVAAALGVTPSSLPFVAPAQSGTRALLRVQDGCDEHCTFCATTLARGANRSRTPDALVTEAQALAERHAEIVLTGVHIGTYGRDIGTSLGALTARLVRDVPAARFRLSSVEATEVDDQLLELFGEPSRLAPHLHAPLQSGADQVLRRMGRHWYTATSYARSIERITQGRATFGLGADIIAGFPGESEAQHHATLDLVRRLPFTYLHVFPYSPRPGTAAPRLKQDLHGEVVRRRAREVREAGAELAARYRESRSGGEADVIVVRGERREGLTGDYLTVGIDGDRVPRGTRFAARLEGSGDRLIARRVVASLPA